MTWKLFCGNSIVDKCGTNESLTKIRSGQDMAGASIPASAWLKKVFIRLPNMKNFSLKLFKNDFDLMAFFFFLVDSYGDLLILLFEHL